MFPSSTSMGCAVTPKPLRNKGVSPAAASRLASWRYSSRKASRPWRTGISRDLPPCSPNRSVEHTALLFAFVARVGSGTPRAIRPTRAERFWQSKRVMSYRLTGMQDRGLCLPRCRSCSPLSSSPTGSGGGVGPLACGRGRRWPARKEHDAKQPGTTRDTLWPRHHQLTSTTRGPSTSMRGVVPSPGAVPAHRTPFSRCGAPVAVLTVT